MEDDVLARAAPSLDGLRAALDRLDALLAGGMERARRLYGEGTFADAYRGLVIREEDALAALAIPGGDVVIGAGAGSPAPDAGPLAEVAAAFGLAPADRDILLLALAPELDTRYGRVLAYLQDDVTRRRPAVGLVLDLLATSAAHKLALRSRLAPGAPLVTGALVETVDDGPLLERTLLAAEPVVAALLGAPAVDPAHARWCGLAEPGAPSALDEAALDSVVRDRLAELGAAPVALLGGDDLQRAAAARIVARAAGRPLLTADLGRRETAREGDLERARRDALLAGAVLHVAGVDEAAPALPGVPLVVSGAGAAEWPGAVAVTLDRPAPGRRRDCWRAVLGPSVDGEPLDALAARFRLSPAAIARAGAAARGAARWREGPGATPTAEDAFAAARATARAALDGLARRVRVERAWEELVLPPDRLELLDALVDEVRLAPRVRTSWGFARVAPAGGVAALFTGPPGTGKTMAAGLVANRLGLDLYVIDLAAVVSKYIGETEKNLARVFDAAEASGAVLLFDEADALFGRRSAVRDAHDRYANVEVGYLLQRLESYTGLAILATNLRQNMDEAFVRRLRFIVDFPAPDAASRRRIWETTWPERAPTAGLDCSELAGRFAVTGAVIRDVALAAAYLAAADGGTVRMDHVEAAMRREYRKLGRVLEAPHG